MSKGVVDLAFQVLFAHFHAKVLFLESLGDRCGYKSRVSHLKLFSLAASFGQWSPTALAVFGCSVSVS